VLALRLGVEAIFHRLDGEIEKLLEAITQRIVQGGEHLGEIPIPAEADGAGETELLQQRQRVICDFPLGVQRGRLQRDVAVAHPRRNHTGLDAVDVRREVVDHVLSQADAIRAGAHGRLDRIRAARAAGIQGDRNERGAGLVDDLLHRREVASRDIALRDAHSDDIAAIRRGARNGYAHDVRRGIRGILGCHHEHETSIDTVYFAHPRQRRVHDRLNIGGGIEGTRGNVQLGVGHIIASEFLRALAHGLGHVPAGVRGDLGAQRHLGQGAEIVSG